MLGIHGEAAERLCNPALFVAFGMWVVASRFFAQPSARLDIGGAADHTVNHPEDPSHLGDPGPPIKPSGGQATHGAAQHWDARRTREQMPEWQGHYG